MSKKDYEMFLKKIDQLNQLVELINNQPEKCKLFVSCKTHEDVVNLAKQWGYEIGKRWGEAQGIQLTHLSYCPPPLQLQTLEGIP